jgi:outer membrane protein assembly factor BamB
MWKLRPVVLLAVMVVLFGGCDWAQYAFDGSNTGHDLSATAFTAASVAGLHQAWATAGPTTSEARLAAVGDTVYVAGSDTVTYHVVCCPPPGTPPPPSPPGPVSALDAATGAVRWTVAGPVRECSDTADERMGAPTVVNGQVLFLRGDQWDCFFESSPVSYATASGIDAATGVVGPAPSGYSQPPDGDAVVAPGGGIYLSEDNLVSGAGELVPTDATIVGPGGFAFTPDPSASLSTGGYRMGTPAVDAHHVFATAGDEWPDGPLGTSVILYAVDRTTAAESWRAVLPAGTDRTNLPVPSVGNGRVFVSTGTALLAYDPEGHTGCSTVAGTTTCTPLWTVPLPDASTVQAPAISRHRVFVRSGSQLTVLRTDDGARLWSASLGTAYGTAATLGPPSIAADVVFVGTADHRLLAFDATGSAGCSGTPDVCTPLWSADLSGGAGVSRPIIAGNAVYISSANGSASTVAKFIL